MGGSARPEAASSSPPPAVTVDRKGKKKNVPAAPTLEYRWSREVPLLATALVATKEAVYIAGPPDEFSAIGEGDELLNLEDSASAIAAWRGEKGGLLYGAAVGDGREVSRVELPSPAVFDGMAAAQGRIYLALQDGSVVCLAGAN